MPQGKGSLWAAAAALLLLAAAADAARPQQPLRAEAAWRLLFRRPAEPPAPPDNPLTTAKVALGARLFSDPRLSGSGDRSCASCHRPERSFTDGRRRARGLTGASLARNTPSLWNLAWSEAYFWDGRAPSLEAQVRMPIAAADEMAGDWPSILGRLNADLDLLAAFQAAFPEPAPISEDSVAKALASYVRSLVSARTRFDAWIEGNGQALEANEVRGFRIFTGKAGCVLCHVGWRFTDDRFHDIGLPGKDAGRGAVAGGTPGLPAFKTPSLRELALTAPYMHDGSRPTLAAVVAHYADTFLKRPSLAPSIRRLDLTGAERADLIAFLGTLSSPGSPAQPKAAGHP
jgi:cytochrome c peroxidase